MTLVTRMNTRLFFGHLASDIVQHASKSVEDVIRAFGAEGGGRNGGYLRAHMLPLLGKFTTLIPLVEMVVGDIDIVRRDRSDVVSFEKVLRLATHSGEGHVTSGQSADPNLDQYPGAILVPITFMDSPTHLILSLSGLLPVADEGGMIVLADRLPKEYGVNLEKVVRVSPNHLAMPLLAA